MTGAGDAGGAGKGPGAPLTESDSVDAAAVRAYAGHGFERADGEPPSPTARKRGPARALQRHMERISALPKAQQKFVLQVLDSVLQQAH